MGIFQKAVETYDAMSHLVGVEVEDKETLAPIGHIIAKATIEVTIDCDGNFINAAACGRKIPIPVTEESSGRTSAPAAHGLCDNLMYISGRDDAKYELYKMQLEGWINSEYTHQKAEAVYKYIIRKTLIDDLISKNAIKVDNNGNIKNEKEIVCWNVIGLGENSGGVWSDTLLQKAFLNYYLNYVKKTKSDVCMVSGELQPKAAQHLKGVVSLYGNAKLVSANDKTNFTYRGRFANDSQALNIGYLSSQKAHNALKWLTSNDCVTFGGRTFICWNPNGIKLVMPNMPFFMGKEKPANPTAYKKKLLEALQGYKRELPDNENVIIASFDAATTGRLALVYYNELRGSDYLERLHYWDSTCCWFDRFGVYSPLIINMVRYAYGSYRKTQHGESFEIEDRILKQQMQQLISCRIDKKPLPRVFLERIVQKAGNLKIYTPADRHNLLFAACAVIRKYRFDRFNEQCKMELEPYKADRSYQYGRLLATMEKIERDNYKDDDKRIPNALRRQSNFIIKPLSTFADLSEKINSAYLWKLGRKSRIYYSKIISQIMEQISQFGDDVVDRKLDEAYLLGYYLQQSEFYKTKADDSENNEEEKNPLEGIAQLEPYKADRSYQYGRLLAIMEKMELDTYSHEEERQPNAIRSQARFFREPLTTFGELDMKLQMVYLWKLDKNARIYYEKLLGQIIEQISRFDGEINKQLDASYIMGYYLQRSELYKSVSADREQNTDLPIEEHEVVLQLEKNNTSYQYGRLLAVMEKMELDTYSDKEERQTNAVRFRSEYVRKPKLTSERLMQKLENAYIKKLNISSKIYYERLCNQINQQISQSENDVNNSLSEDYIMGYYLQRNALYKSNAENNQ